MNSLELRCHPSRLIAECVNTVTQYISSNETLVSSLDGLECLVLQGIFYNNDGKLRSAWLSYRRALNIAQIIGFHRLPFDVTTDSEFFIRARHIWYHIIYADRYLSLMLGMYHGISDVSLDSQRELVEMPNSSPMDQLCRIAGLIIERNQKFQKVTPSMVRMTQNIDSEFTSMDVPFVVEDSAIPSSGKSTERVRCYRQLMTRLWYYQLLSWLHLPLLLESRSHGCYDYSRQSCLEASRHMITYYTSIRRLTADSFCCKSLEFQAFTAAVTLMINILGSSGQPNTNSNDWTAVETVMKNLEILTEGQTPDKVATQGLNVLRTLRNIAVGNLPTEPASPKDNQSQYIQSGRIKVDIPYFGTICLDCDIRNSRSKQQESIPDLLRPVIHNEQAENSAMVPNVEISPETTTAQYQSADMEPWLETNFGLGSADMWTLDPEMPTLLPFFPNAGDSWDLGL